MGGVTREDAGAGSEFYGGMEICADAGVADAENSGNCLACAETDS